MEAGKRKHGETSDAIALKMDGEREEREGEKKIYFFLRVKFNLRFALPS